MLKRLGRFALERTDNLEQLRGYEGMAAAAYFSRLSDFFPENIPFRERSRRPPGDAANSILSWTYSIVQGEIDAVIRCHGLDPCIGFLHAISHGTPSLTLDLLEPLRAPLCDLLSLHLLNHRILREEHFEFNTEDGGTYLKPEARKEFFFSYENAMIRKFTLKPGEKHVDFRKIIENSVLAVLKAIQGDSNYEFFIMP
jgi:CRISPR-associated protein Cas1